MEFLKFLSQIDPGRTAYIVLLSLIYGGLGGIFPPAVIRASQEILAGQHYWLYAVLLPVISGVMLLANWLAKKQTAIITERALEDIILRIANTVRQMELQEFERLDRSKLYLSIVDAQSITNAATRSIHLLQNILMVFTAWLYLVWRATEVGLLFLLTWLLLLLMHEAVRKTGGTLFQQNAQAERRLFDLCRHLLDGFKEIKLSRQKNDDLFARYLTPVIRQAQRLHYVMVVWNTDYTLFTYVCLYVVLGIEAFLVSSGYATALKFELLIIGMYFIKPVRAILLYLPLIANGQAALERLNQSALNRSGTKVIVSEVELRLYDPAQELLQDFQQIVLQDVAFTYHKADASAGFAVGPLTFALHRGELVFLAGGNGSGKSTLLKLLTGLYPPDAGAVTIDGVPVALADHRYLFASVFTDFHLFDALYGVAAVDPQRLNDLLGQMELADKTAYADGRFRTLDLSTGQRKRLALIAALLEDKPIYVFDEWAADQDPHFRRYFYEELLPALKKQGKTVIAVTHDDAYFHLAERVLLMEEGKIAAEWLPQREPGRKLAWSSVGPAPDSLSQPTSPGDAAEAQAGGQPPETADAALPPEQPAEFTFLQRSELRKHLKRLGLLAIVDGISNALRLHVLFAVLTLAPGASLDRLFLLFLLATIVNTVATQQFRNYLTRLTEDLIATLRLKILERVRQTDLASFERLGAERIYAALTSDLKVVSEISLTISITFSLTARAISLLGMLALISPPVFLFEVCLFGLAGIFYLQNQLQIRQAVEAGRDREITFFEGITHLLDGFKELRLNRRKSDDFFHACLRPIYAQVKQCHLRSLDYQLINYTLVYGLWMASVALLPLLLPFFGADAQKVGFEALGLILMLPVNVLVDWVSQIFLSFLSFQRLTRLEDVLKTFAQEPGEVPPEERQRGVESLRYREVAFQYHDQEDYPFQVAPGSFQVEAGKLLFLIGGNGSGKTTLLKLLTGLYQKDAGQIFLNGQEIDMRQHRYLFSAVFTDFHLFDRLYGVPQVDAQQVNDLLKLMRLDDKVRFAEGQFSTLDLSTGQRKRLALVTALLEDRPILVFDEWAAGQDPEFREYFYQTLLPTFKRQGKTVIAITHDDHYFAVADRIVQMEYGQLSEHGAPGKT